MSVNDICRWYECLDQAEPAAGSTPSHRVAVAERHWKFGVVKQAASQGLRCSGLARIDTDRPLYEAVGNLLPVSYCHSLNRTYPS